MKSFILTISLIVIADSLKAQCNADANCPFDSLICASNNSPACENQPYTQVLTIAVPTSFTDPGSGTVVPIKRAKVDSIRGFPNGIIYQCSPANCTINAGLRGCILISGTPTSPSIYPTLTYTTITVSINIGTPTFPFYIDVPFDTAIAGTFVVQAKDCANVCGGSAAVDNCGICSGGNTGILPNCDDGNACTLDACNGQGGCTHQPSCNVTISGKIQTEAGTGIPGVTVNLTGSQAQSLTTLADGLYNFTVMQGGSYTVTPSKNNDVPTNTGVTTGDIPLIRKQALTQNFLTSPYRIIAADANNSGGVSTADVTFTRRVALNGNNTFPLTTSPLVYGRLWEFINTDSPPTLANPFSFTKTRNYSNLVTSQTNQNFIGVKIGDANGSWSPPSP